MDDGIYPMNPPARFPARDAPTSRWKAADNFSGYIINPQTGDITVEAAYRTIVTASRDVYRSLAFFDVVDTKLDATAASATAAQDTLAQIDASATQLTNSLKAMEGRVDALIETVTSALAATGQIIVPEWLSTREVQEGDSMGLARQSASDLGLVVRYEPPLQSENEWLEIAYTDPKPGSLAKLGSTVVVYTKR